MIRLLHIKWQLIAISTLLPPLILGARAAMSTTSGAAAAGASALFGCVTASPTASSATVMPGSADPATSPVFTPPTASPSASMPSSGGGMLVVVAPISLTTAANASVIQTVTLENAGTQALTWQASAQTADQGTWLQLAPTSGELAVGQSSVLVVSAHTEGLAPGTYTGTVEIDSDGGNESVPVQLSVTAPGNGSSPDGQSGGVSSQSSTGSGAVAPAQPSTSSSTPCPTASNAPSSTQPSSSSAAPMTSSCEAASPYGVTTINGDSMLVQESRQLGICWVRLQMDETTIQPQPGTFNWSKLDAAVATLNAAGIHIDFPLRCFGGSCFQAPTLPTPQQMAAYAQAVASRYDGAHGHGKIDAFEILNEEADFFSPASYGPILQAGYQAIKAVYPQAQVGMYGTFKPSLTHVEAVMSAIANGFSQDLDFANFHYYAHGENPAVSTGDHPSLAAEIQAIHQILPDKPIWLTEVGWPISPLPGIQAVSPEIQAQYLQEVMQMAQQSGVVARVFWFTLDYGNQPDSIFPPDGPLPAFTVYQQYVAQHPLWQTGASASLGAPTTPTATALPSSTPTPMPPHW